MWKQNQCRIRFGVGGYGTRMFWKHRTEYEYCPSPYVFCFIGRTFQRHKIEKKMFVGGEGGFMEQEIFRGAKWNRNFFQTHHVFHSICGGKE